MYHQIPNWSVVLVVFVWSLIWAVFDATEDFFAMLIDAKMYRNDAEFSDRQAWANSADPDQTAPRGAPRGIVWSGSTLFAVPSASFSRITLW